MMDFYRMPEYAGPNFEHITQAVVRGNTRRDVVGGVAKFSSLSAGQTLGLQIDATPSTVVFTGNSVATILSDINAEIGPVGEAYEQDGFLHIKSTTIGSPSLVQVTGGTGAEALGFDLKAQDFLSVAGSPPSSIGPGVPFGVRFPSKGEGLDQGVITRAMAQLGANLDSLYADLLKVEPVPTLVSGSLSSDGSYFTPTATQKVFTGYGLLSASSTKEDLAPYFYVLDPTTKNLAPTRVVAVVKGAPTGDPAYSNTASYAANDGGNVLGRNLQKTSTAITAIKNGRVVKCSGASFLTTAAIGDLAEITGAANTSPWSNNGMRWVVEKVIDNEHLALRPMSKDELTTYGQSFTDDFPVLSLNTSTTGGLGTLKTYTGSWCEGVSLVLRPALPTGVSWQMYAAVPTPRRGASQSVRADPLKHITRAFVSDYESTPNDLLFAPRVTAGSGLTANVGACYLRWNDRTFRRPASTLTLSNNATNYIYWDSSDGAVKNTTTASTALSWSRLDPTVGSDYPNTKKAILAKVITSGGAITRIENTGRQLAEDVRTITVGRGGQFANLQDAFAYVNTWADLDYAGSGAAYPHFEIVLVSGVSYTRPSVPDLSVPSITIRGVCADTSLSMNGAIKFTGGGTIRLENLRLVTMSDTYSIIELSGGNTLNRVEIDSVTAAPLGIDTAYRYVVEGGASDQAALVSIRNSNLQTSRGVLSLAFADKVTIQGSNFYAYTTGYGYERVLSNPNGTGWSSSLTTIEGCSFDNWNNLQSNLYASLAYVSAGQFYFLNNTWTATPTGGLVNVNKEHFFYKTGSVSVVEFSGNDISGVKYLVGDAGTKVVGNKISVSPDSGAVSPVLTGVVAGHVLDNNITVAASVGSTQGIAVEALHVAQGNTISGTARIGVKATGTNRTSICQNYISNTYASGIGVFVAADDVTIEGNNIYLSGQDAYGVAWDVSSPRYRTRVLHNTITTTGTGSYGVYMESSNVDLPVIVGNSFQYFKNALYIVLAAVVEGNIFDGQDTTSVALYFYSTDAQCRVVGNLFNGTAFQVAGGNYSAGLAMTVSGNYFSASPGPARCLGSFTGNMVDAEADLYAGCVASGNVFRNPVRFNFANTNDRILFVGNSTPNASTVTDVGTAGYGHLVMTGNDIQYAATLDSVGVLNAVGNSFASTFTGTQGRFLNNNVAGNFAFSGTAGAMEISGNRFGGSCTIGATSYQVNFSNNSVVGALTSTATGRVHVTNNMLATSGAALDSTSITAWSQILYSGNSHGGDVFLSGTGPSRVVGNLFIGTSSTAMPAFQLGNGGSPIRAAAVIVGNQFYKDANTKCVQVVGSPTYPSAHVTFDGNYIQMASSLGTSSNGLELTAIQGGAIVANKIDAYMAAIQVGLAADTNHCLDLRITGNHLKSAYTNAAAGVGVVQLGKSKRAQIAFNTLETSSSNTSSAPAVDVSVVASATNAVGTVLGTNWLLGPAGVMAYVDSNSGTGADDTYFQANLTTTNPGASTNAYAGGVRS